MVAFASYFLYASHYPDLVPPKFYTLFSGILIICGIVMHQRGGNRHGRKLPRAISLQKSNILRMMAQGMG